jgi:two-component system cell cycle response regulator DivK
MTVVLVVEDNELNRELLVQLLEDEYEVVTAADGERGVALAKESMPDLILMDLSIPLLDGLQATTQIKADPASAGIPVIALTSYAMPADEQRARAAGCDDYLTKPIDEELLFATIARHVDSGG